MSVTITWPSQQRLMLQLLSPFLVWVSHHMTLLGLVVFLVACGSQFSLLMMRYTPEFSPLLFRACCFKLICFFRGFLPDHKFTECTSNPTPRVLSQGRENIIVSLPSPTLLFLIWQCVVVCHLQCTVMLQASLFPSPHLAFDHSTHIPDCIRFIYIFSPFTLACKCFCLFIVSLNVSHAVIFSLPSDVCEIVQ